MGPVALIAVIVLTIINLIIYHKIFDVYYFGSGALLKEIVGAFILAMVEMGVIMHFGTSVLGIVVTAIAFIVKVVLIVLVVAIAVIALVVIISLIAGNKDKINDLFNKIKEKLYINNRKKNSEFKNMNTSYTDVHHNAENQNIETSISKITKAGKEQREEKKQIQCKVCGKNVPYKASVCKYCKSVIR